MEAYEEEDEQTTNPADARLVYVDCITNMPKAVVKSVANVLGMSPAQQRVDHWFNNYTELLYDRETAQVVMMKRRTNGYWEPNGNALLPFKHRD